MKPITIQRANLFFFYAELMQKRIKIGHVSLFYPPVGGGGEVYLERMIRPWETLTTIYGQPQKSKTIHRKLIENIVPLNALVQALQVIRTPSFKLF